ncbi:MAG: helix-turn-helix domain-containing protein [Rhodospirillaceae bacterium]|nr:helix-turn-helix domain-containing protein [Rhodospirillaceae bacterium]
MSTLRTGIASYESMKARTLAIAGGRYKPAEDDPSVWFASVESFAKVLSERNRELLALIAREKPASLTELPALSGRNKSNLSRTLKTMSKYGLVEMTDGRRGRLIPRVPYDRVNLDLPLTSMPREAAQAAA